MTNPADTNPARDALLAKLQDAIPLWGDELLDKMKAIGMANPGVYIIAVDGETKVSAGTSNMGPEAQAYFLEEALEHAESQLADPIEKLFASLGGKRIDLGDGITAFEVGLNKDDLQ